MANNELQQTEQEQQVATEAITPELVEHNGIVSPPSLACKERINEAISSQAKAFYDLALGLEEAYRCGYAKDWGYPNFRAYVENHLKLRPRRVFYLVKCGEAIAKHDIPKERVTKIGWTRFREIAKPCLESPEKAAKLLEMAESLTVRELSDEVRGIRTTEGKDAVAGSVRLSFRFDSVNKSLIEDAFKTASEEAQSNDAHAQFMHIITEWMLSKSNSSTMSTLEDWITYLEGAFGRKIAVVESNESIEELLATTEAEATTSGFLNDEDAELDNLYEGQDPSDIDDDVNALLGFANTES